ncbi:MAG TPA: hypothetical protein VFB49_09395 [Patescibacteria group bacterium]|jgi:hypothetical protein|nr:hypothetical protein [Patescibacteria group bacterium]
MRVIDKRTEEVLVERDAADNRIEVQVGAPGDAGARIVRLTLEEARRFAALLLFEAARLEHPHVHLAPVYQDPERPSA